MTPLGECLRAARQAKGLSLRDLGKAIDRAFETIGSVERGERTPSKELLRRLCAALDLDLADMMPLSGRLPPEMVDYLCAAPAARDVVWQMMAAGFRPQPILVGPTPPEVLSRQQEFLTELAASPPPRFYVGHSGPPADGVLRMSSVGFLPGPDATTKDEHGIDRAAFASFSANGYRCSRCQATGKTLDGMVAACTCAPVLAAPPTEAIAGRCFAPSVTTPPVPETANLLIPGVPMTLPTSAAYLRGRFVLEFSGTGGEPCGMAEVPSGAVTVSITYLDAPAVDAEAVRDDGRRAGRMAELIERARNADGPSTERVNQMRAELGCEPLDPASELGHVRLDGFSFVNEGGHPMQRIPIAGRKEPKEDEGAPLSSLEDDTAGAAPINDLLVPAMPGPPASDDCMIAFLHRRANPNHRIASVFTEEMRAAGRAVLVPMEGLVTLEMRFTRDGHEGRLLFRGADGEILEAAADGVPHAVPVGTDHVKMTIRRKS